MEQSNVGNSTTAGDPGDASVRGTQQPDGVGTRRLAGGRFGPVPVGAIVTIGLSYVRDVDLVCIEMSPALAVNFVATTISVADTQFIAQNPPQSNLPTVAAGVPATAFLPYGVCSEFITGFCLRASVSFNSSWQNISAAPSFIDLTLVANVRPGPTC